MEKSILDAILARPDVSLLNLALLAVIGGLLWVIKSQSAAQKEAMCALSAAMSQMSQAITDLRVELATRAKR